MCNKVTILIKTFERYECLREFLLSIKRNGLTCPILIADDSKENYKKSITGEFGSFIKDYFVLPYDSGLSYGRNFLLDMVETDYFLLCDDDFIFDARTDLNFMVDLVLSSDIDILGGLVFNRCYQIQDNGRDLLSSLIKLKPRTSFHIFLWHLNRHKFTRLIFSPILLKEKQWDFYGNFKIVGQICYKSRLSDCDYRDPFTYCDYVPNFFLARTLSLKENDLFWDVDMNYGGQHLDFFFRAKEKSLVVAVTKKVGVIHQRILVNYHLQGINDRHIMMRKNNLREIREVDDNLLKNI